MIRIAVLGAGGFAREVKWLIEQINQHEARYDFRGFIVRSADELSANDSSEDVWGDENRLEGQHDQLDALVIGIGDPAIRLRLGRDLSAKFPHLRWPALIHPSVLADFSSCAVGRGALICASTVLTVNVTVREFAMINLCCTIGHESLVGAGSVINPSANVSGGVRLGEGVFVGTGAQIFENLTIGDGAKVGGGAVVTRNVPEGVTVVGTPVKYIAK